ncbi:MAG: sulfite exporter TauE/SafE family protein [Novosphingobium sp.]|nr:sulfite exporter TauE/SafE family protein [Novosphingobium sp.]MBO9600989.1 sulfite exporter TauE/SafE family protein [Novosphingobium sp.]
MNLLQQIDALHAFAGLLVGFLVGMTGVGGGALMTPVLVLLFGVSPQTAVGTDLLYASITKIVGSAVHGWRDTVEWPIVRRLALGSVPAAIVTIVLLSLIGKPSPSTEHVTLFALACLLAFTSLTVVFRGWLTKFAADLDPLRPPVKAMVGTVGLGAVIGVAVSLTSVGAGAIGVTALLLLYPRLPIVRIVGSDIAHAVPLALVAGFGHWLIGDVDGVLLTNLLIGSIPGVIAGSLLSTRAPEKFLRPLLAAVLAISSWQLFQKVSTPAEKPAQVAPAAHASADRPAGQA